MKNNLSNFLTGKKFMVIASFLGLYLLTTGSAWALFTYLSAEPESGSKITEAGRREIDPSLPKTEECPINGKMFSKPEREIWETRRPMTAIIENHADSRPQSGLSFADVVYETVAEGGITRFLSVFYCGAAAKDVRIAPVRSIRVYFINWAAEYSKTPILVHSGGANNICSNCPGGVKPRGDIDPKVDAFKVLTNLGWRGPKGNAMDAGTNLGFPAVKRDQYRLGEKAAWEHSYEGYTDGIYEVAAERGFANKEGNGEDWDKNFESWQFTDDKALGSAKASEISFNFWPNKGDYDVSWKYNTANNSYLRFNGGKDHTDHETTKQIEVKNVVIQFIEEEGPVDKEGHMFYTNIENGKAIFFQNGDAIVGTWEKRSQFDRTKFFDDSGKEIKFVRGQIWIEGGPAGNDVNY